MTDKTEKLKIVTAFIKELKLRWKNIKELSKEYPEEGLVLAYCFTEALGYYRFGFGDNPAGLKSSEWFFKVLHDYQSNRVFMEVPHLFIEKLPLEKGQRTIGKDVSEVFLKWLKTACPKNKDLHISTIWEQVPDSIAKIISNSSSKFGNLQQLTWAGYYYQFIRNAGVHYGNFSKTSAAELLPEIIKANDEILYELESECLSENKFPHELEQPKSLYDVVH